MCDFYTVMDFETSDLAKHYNKTINEHGYKDGPYKHIYIYSGAFIIMRIDRETKKIINTLEKYIVIKPIRNNKIISVDKSEIHTLTNTYLMNMGVMINEFLDMASKIIQSSCQFIGHNINYDIGVLIAELSRSDNEYHKSAVKRLSEMSLNGSYFCTCQHVSLKKSPSKKLADVYKAYTGKDAENCHNALSDTQMCKEIYMAMKKIN